MRNQAVPPSRSLESVGLTQQMERTQGSPDLIVGIVDGPIAWTHPDLASTRLRRTDEGNSSCNRLDSYACAHGTFVAGVLCARRGSDAPAICPGCTFVTHPIYSESNSGMPIAAADVLAGALYSCLRAGARLINLSGGVQGLGAQGQRTLTEVLDLAANRGTIVVAAVGNDGSVRSSEITRHPAVIPVTAADQAGRPLTISNLGASTGRRGLSAPGTVKSLSPIGGSVTWIGTSVAAPLVTGALALLWSEFPSVSARTLRFLVSHSRGGRASVVPPLLAVGSVRAALALISSSERRVIA